MVGFLGDKFEFATHWLTNTAIVMNTLHRLSDRVRQSLGVIHSSFLSKHLSAKILKRDCNIRDNNFSSVFRREVGVSIRDYIEDLRIKHACGLLRDGSMNVTDVGYVVGYEHVQTFYRAFKRRMSCTPYQYQQKLRHAGAE